MAAEVLEDRGGGSDNVSHASPDGPFADLSVRPPVTDVADRLGESGRQSQESGLREMGSRGVAAEAVSRSPMVRQRAKGAQGRLGERATECVRVPVKIHATSSCELSENDGGRIDGEEDEGCKDGNGVEEDRAGEAGRGDHETEECVRERVGGALDAEAGPGLCVCKGRGEEGEGGKDGDGGKEEREGKTESEWIRRLDEVRRGGKHLRPRCVSYGLQKVWGEERRRRRARRQERLALLAECRTEFGGR